MSEITAESNQKQYPLMPTGNHIARCYQIIHIGTIPETYKGETKMRNLVRASFETPDEKFIFSEEKGEQPFSISKKWTLSMHEKGNLKKDLQAWRGKPFKDDEAKKFNISKLIGAPCMINVIHEEYEGRKYAKITSITPLVKGMTCPPQINPTLIFGYAPFNQETFDSLGQWLKDEIVKSKEYQALKNPSHTETEENLNTGDGSATLAEDDLPF
jgi:hypothetical protein